MPFASVFNVSDIDGSNGFVVASAGASTLTGFSVAGTGDLNGDGFRDFVVSAVSAATAAGTKAGRVYVVYGDTGGFPASLDPATLDGTNGFRINGATAEDYAGWSVADAGDVNGDGVTDLLIGAARADTTLGNEGAAYVVFGRTGDFPAQLDLSALDGSNGFRVQGQFAYGELGRSISGIGDINGDGIDDIAVAAWQTPSGGETYVIFGKTTPFAASMQPSALNGSNGFKIVGEINSRLGVSVASAGDVNGDGLDDMIVGASNGNGYRGAAYVVFGSEDAFAATLDIADIDGTNGFQLVSSTNGQRVGNAVSSAGDVNGDGFDDLLIGAYGFGDYFDGAVYVVFGKAGGFDAQLTINDVDGTDGFRVEGVGNYASTGASVSAIGDLDNDGFDDIMFGQPYGYGTYNNTGVAYVVYGKAGGFANLTVNDLDGTNGFRINGFEQSSGTAMAVAASDVNGDGGRDLIIGASRAGASLHGTVYVIYADPSDLTYTGTTGDDTQAGGDFDDTLLGGGGRDVLSGMDGDDLLDGGALSDTLSGGLGADELFGGDGGDLLNGDDGADVLTGGEGGDKLNGGAGADELFGGAGNDRFDGDQAVDELNGGAGNDHIDGGAGADLMTGGAGNDVFIVDDAGDQTIEAVGEGFDIVRTAIGWTLADNVEALEQQGSGDVAGTGNGGANNIQGNSGHNILSGLGGVDTINGNDGDDIVIGGEGNDLLRGGLGADDFRVAHAFGATLETDQVFDFSTAEGDRIDLSAIDAVAGGGDDAFVLVGSFTRAAGQMTLTFAAGQTILRLDLNGDARVDYQMRINGDVTGDSGGWLL
jgi:Ca2+-binding RTX toxin-like protein